MIGSSFLVAGLKQLAENNHSLQGRQTPLHNVEHLKVFIDNISLHKKFLCYASQIVQNKCQSCVKIAVRCKNIYLLLVYILQSVYVNCRMDSGVHYVICVVSAHSMACVASVHSMVCVAN